MRIALTTVLLLLLTTPAQAAPRTVARFGEFTLQAQMTKGELCITLRRNRHYQGQECGPIPRSPHRPLHVFPDIGFNNYASAVPPSVAYVERESPGGRRKRYPAAAAEGFAAHFVIVPTPPGVMFVRFYAADGTLLGIDGGQAGYITWDTDRTILVGEHRFGAEAYTEPRLAPTPDQADRLLTLACVDVANDSGGSGVCNADTDNAVVVMGSCRGPDLIGGFVAPAVASVRFTLGSGAQHVVTPIALAPRFNGWRGIGSQVPAGEAVRDATALDVQGQPLAHVEIGTAPGRQPCAGTDQGDDRFSGNLEPVTPPPGVVVASDGAVPLLVADQGERLCVALVGLGAGNCPAAPVDSDEPDLQRRGNTVAAALSRDADRVTLRFNRGPDLTVKTTDGPAYTGRWAGRVRFVIAHVPPGRTVKRVTVRNAAGAIIGLGKGVAPTVTRIRELTDGLELVRSADGWRCVRAISPHAPAFCTDPDPGTQIDGPFLPYHAAVVVTCEPRRAIAYGRLPDQLAVPRVVLAGRSVKPRRIALKGDDAWVAVLPDAPVRGLRSGKRSVKLRLPPASAQCGYDLARSF
jgi:hypothetical protein